MVRSGQSADRGGSGPAGGGSGQSADGGGSGPAGGGQVQPEGGQVSQPMGGGQVQLVGGSGPAGRGGSGPGGGGVSQWGGGGGQHLAPSCGRYASCVHAGGLSCLILLCLHKRFKGKTLVTDFFYSAYNFTDVKGVFVRKHFYSFGSIKF